MSTPWKSHHEKFPAHIEVSKGHSAQAQIS